MTRYEVSDAVFETPRYLQVPGTSGVTPTSATGPTFVVPYESALGEHDLIGSGWVELADGLLTVAIRPAGIVGHFEPREKRTYQLSMISGWRVSGDVIELSIGTVGPVATDGAEAPSHLGTMKCASEDEAQALTSEARAAGVVPRQPPRHSGI